MTSPVFFLSLLGLMLVDSLNGQVPSEIKLLPNAEFARKLDDKPVQLYVLRNENGMTAEITNYGARVVSLWVPDRAGRFGDVVLGFGSLQAYLDAKDPYFGAVIGRYANRIGEAELPVADTTYALRANDGLHQLHGGAQGFHTVVWEADQIDEQTLDLRYVSPHLQEGYPGELTVRVRYHLSNENALKIEYEATVDRPTVVNLTHHSFFNLRGEGNGTINDHLLQINAAYFTPVGEGLIPTGQIATVEGTPFDFRQPMPIGRRLRTPHPQLTFGNGYDHNFVLNQTLDGLNYAAKVIEPISGRVMEVLTNEPGLQFYGGNFLDGTVVGKTGKTYDFRGAFCLESQHFPDSPHHPHFPSTVLQPGEGYYSVCIYRFSTVR